MKSESILLEALVERLKQHSDYSEAHPAYVSIYRRSQCYGGPEEGGWWYDRISLEGHVRFATREQAEAFLEQAMVEVERLNQEEAPMRARAFACLPDEDLEPCPANCSEGYIPQDWTDGGELFVVVEEKLGLCDNMNEPTPHYC